MFVLKDDKLYLYKLLQYTLVAVSETKILILTELRTTATKWWNSSSWEQELTRTEVARKIAKESGRGLKKGIENGTEQCHEVERVQKEMKQYEQCVNQSEQGPKKGREIPKKSAQRAKELSKLIPVTKLMYSRARTVI